MQDLSIHAGDGSVTIPQFEGADAETEQTRLASLNAAIEAFKGAAEEAGIVTENDVVALVKEVRAELWAERHAPTT